MIFKQIMMAGGLLIGLAGCSSSEVDTVKIGSLPTCSNHTLEEMVDRFFDAPSWESREIRVKQIIIKAGAGGLFGLTECSPEVVMVKGGSLSTCLSHTLEEMTDGFFGLPFWESGESVNGVKFVNVSGDMVFSGKKVTGILQFSIGKDNKTFQYRAFEINEVPQNKFMAVVLLKKMCDSAVLSSGV